jgi:hypothetical protein
VPFQRKCRQTSQAPIQGLAHKSESKADPVWREIGKLRDKPNFFPASCISCVGLMGMGLMGVMRGSHRHASHGACVSSLMSMHPMGVLITAGEKVLVKPGTNTDNLSNEYVGHSDNFNTSIT